MCLALRLPFDYGAVIADGNPHFFPFYPLVFFSRSMTYPSLPDKSKLPARGRSLEFDSNDIPVDADAVVALIKKQLLPVEEEEEA